MISSDSCSQRRSHIARTPACRGSCGTRPSLSQDHRGVRLHLPVEHGRKQLGPFLGPELVLEGRNLILSGKPGRGKTHIAVAVAYKAIQNGFDARFVTASDLIDELHAAAGDGSLRAATAAYVEPHVLVIDEVGYLQCASDAANVLYGVVDQRCLKRRPIVFASQQGAQAMGRGPARC